MKRSITVILCVLVAVSLAGVLKAFIAAWVLLVIALILLVLWILTADPH